MQEHIKKIITERAQVLAKLAVAILRNDDPNDYSATEAFKYAYLVMCKPKKYLERFGIGDLKIDLDEVNSLIWNLQGDLPGINDVMPEELYIIETHNQEVDAYLKEKQSGLKLVR